jgi:hypothetical protein
MTRIMPSARAIALCLCAGCLGLAVAQAPGGFQTLNQLRKDPQAQADGSEGLPLASVQGVDSTPTKCPNPAALDLFKHQIAYQRTEELNPFKGLQELHADVWQRGPLTGFYVRDKLAEFVPTIRMTYLFGKGGLQGGGSCAADKNWRECVEKSAGSEYATDVVGTCAVTIDINAMPAWKPSPNDSTKKRIVDELRSEIEAKWPGVQEIVIRDFNLKDNQIMMYLKMPDGDYYQGCGFNAMTEPHCEGWHLFGQAPVSSLRKRIFDLPYRLK